MIERARFSSCVVTLSRSPRIMNRFSPFFSFFTNVGSIIYRALPIPDWKLSVSKLSLTNHCKEKKKKKKRKNSPLQWKSFSFVHDETLVVIESLLTDESYHSGIPLSVTHTIRFYLKLSRNIFLSSIRFEHGYSRAEIESSRCYFSLAVRPIEAEMYESRSMTRNRNAPFHPW